MTEPLEEPLPLARVVSTTRRPSRAIPIVETVFETFETEPEALKSFQAQAQV